MRRLWLIFFACLLATPARAAPRGPLVLAAASLQQVLGDAADQWAAAGHPRPVLVFAASSTLARQAASGAGGDLFISADRQWMDWLAARGALVPGSRARLAGNRLVLIAPAGQPLRLDLARAGALQRLPPAARIAVADPAGVPAGRYARQALGRLGAWPALAPRLVRAENVRAALALVVRGAAGFGIVYASDAAVTPQVAVIGLFPAASHAPIDYPIARLRSSRHPEAEAFRRYLLSPPARALFARRGFTA